MNITVVHIIHGYCSKNPKLWDEHLHYIKHAYNWSKHSSTQTSQFEACFGYLPKSPLDFIFGKDVVIDGHSDIDKAKHSLSKFNSCIKWFKNNWKRAKPSTREGMISIALTKIFKLEMKFGFTLEKRGSKKKLKI